MQRFSPSRLLSRRWLVLVAVVAVAVALPWSYHTPTTHPAVVVNVSAQGDSNSIGCRIKIDAVNDERPTNTLTAYTYCLGKSG